MLAAAPPLTDAQRTAVEDVADRTPSIDEAGLYALLNNATDWPDKIDQLLPGARLVDPELIRNEPARARAELFVLDGRLLSISDPGLYSPERQLSRSGWEHVEAWHVRVDGGMLAVVCLTDPPDVAGEVVNQHRVPSIENLRVRIPARFFKLVNSKGQDGTWRTYPVFVGHAARLTGGQVAASSDEDEFEAWPYALLFAAVIVLLLIFGYVRAKARQPSKLAERLERHPPDEDEFIVRTDLPEDPAAALQTLELEHELDEAPARTDATNKDAAADGDRQSQPPPSSL